MCTVLSGKINCTNNRRHAALTGGAKDLNCHQPDIPRHPHVRVPVACLGPDGASHVSSVAVAIHRVTVVADDVRAVNIVHIAVKIVVQTVVRHLILIDPHLVGQVLMGVAHTGVDHGNDSVAGADGDVPRLGGIYVGAVRAAVLPLVVQAPERAVGEGRVICHPVDGTVKVRLDVAEQVGVPRLVKLGLQRAGELAGNHLAGLGQALG